MVINYFIKSNVLDNPGMAVIYIAYHSRNRVMNRDAIFKVAVFFNYSRRLWPKSSITSPRNNSAYCKKQSIG